MKFVFVALMSLFAAVANAAPVLSCKSFAKVEGWNASPTNDYVYFTADVESDERLVKAVVKGAYQSDTYDIAADPNYKPVAKSYQGHNRFAALEDAWHWFRAVLPKDLGARTAPFKGYLQINGEEGYKETIALRCWILR
ncbi:MAG: hypothetical protein KF767_08275 [Bdellovibrionaceae bacterium]|nr:hypothetical protein [Pseudobdellovibrionaceae bacterium]